MSPVWAVQVAVQPAASAAHPGISHRGRLQHAEYMAWGRHTLAQQRIYMVGPSPGLTLVMLSSFWETFWKQQQKYICIFLSFFNIWMTQMVGNLLHRRKGSVNTLRPRRNGRYFADDIIKCIFFNENVWISIKISLKFVPKGPINNIPALVQIMAWRRSGDKPLSEPMVVSLPTHICVARPQWVKPGYSIPLLLMSWWCKEWPGSKPLTAPMLTQTHYDIVF